ncbi:MAG: TetR/AcrR family transcriptional regulator [Streptosporangiaceae bacterium]
MNTASELVPPASATAAPATAPRRRQRNARGQGARLTEDIVTGALALIERSGSAEAVTLRAVAREVGISAPSIYAHFADRDAIVMAVVLRVFDELAGAIERGSASAPQDPVERLVAGCGEYVGYGLAHPARYGVLFSGPHGTPQDYCAPVPLGPEGRTVLEFGAEAFALLVQGIEDCAEAGASASTDVMADSTAVWVALHGAVTLRTSLPGFPWPEPENFVRHLVLSLARITGHPDGG